MSCRRSGTLMFLMFVRDRECRRGKEGPWDSVSSLDMPLKARRSRGFLVASSFRAMECLQPKGPGPLWERRWQWHSSLAQDHSDQVQMRNQIEHTRQEVQTRSSLRPLSKGAKMSGSKSQRKVSRQKRRQHSVVGSVLIMCRKGHE